MSIQKLTSYPNHIQVQKEINPVTKANNTIQFQLPSPVNSLDARLKWVKHKDLVNFGHWTELFVFSLIT